MKFLEVKDLNLVERLTVKNAFEKFIQHCTIKNLSKETIKFYKEKCNYFISSIKETYIDEITRRTIEDFVFYEKENDKRTTTLNTKLRGVRAFLYFCMEREYMKTFKIALLKADIVEKEPYSNTELALLLERPKTKRWTDWRNWALENYLLATGNRIETVRNVKIKDLDFENNLIKLSRTKNRKQQIIPMSKSLKSVIIDYLRTWDYTPDNYLFPQNEGKQMARRTLQQAISDYNKKKGITKTSAHLFRHTFAKNYITAGGNMIKLQKLLGHSTLDMTMHYVNLYGSDLSEDYDNLNPLNNLITTKA